jgi:hypothetical protein
LDHLSSISTHDAASLKLDESQTIVEWSAVSMKPVETAQLSHLSVYIVVSE